MRSSTNPKVLWTLFGIAVLVLAGGLTALSRHSLRLSHQQQLVQQENVVRQHMRVALWRLDSRLGPALAKADPLVGEIAPFIHQQFRVAPVIPASKTTQSHCELQYIDDSGAIARAIPLERLTAIVDELAPLDVPYASNAMLVVNNGNSYASPPLDQRFRNSSVQSQLSLNLPNFESEDSLLLAPFWVGDELVVVRKLRMTNVFSGLWFKWPELRESLREDIADLLPAVKFRPVPFGEEPDPARTLAALPIELSVPSVTFTSTAWSTTHTALLIAWMALLVASGLAALALGRLIALNERRSMFVSAVTHELRTPLTTFRLYSDLLARDMVSDPSDRREYLTTLQREADRLTHLVDNVLRYSKLEKSKPANLESTTLSLWMTRIEPRLKERLVSTGLTLEVSIEQDGTWLTDPASLEQLVFNLIDNCAKYANPSEDKRVSVLAARESNQVTIAVVDRGRGVPKELRKVIFQPFAKTVERAAETAAGVGLGLALARRTANALGGDLRYEDTDGGGATFRLRLPIS